MMCMKKWRAMFIVGWGILYFPGIQLSQSSKSPFAISISLPDGDVKAGEVVLLKIRLTNTSGTEIPHGSSYFASGVDTSFQYDCRDSEGKPALRELPADGSFHEIPAIQPGESRVQTVPISRACNLSHSGKYAIQVSRRLSGDPKDGVANSNKITITVAP